MFHLSQIYKYILVPLGDNLFALFNFPLIILIKYGLICGPAFQPYAVSSQQAINCFSLGVLCPVRQIGLQLLTHLIFPPILP